MISLQHLTTYFNYFLLKLLPFPIILIPSIYHYYRFDIILLSNLGGCVGCKIDYPTFINPFPIATPIQTYHTDSNLFQENPNKLKTIQIDRLQFIIFLIPSFNPWLTILQLYHMTQYPVFVPSYYHVLFSLLNHVVLFIPCYSNHPIFLCYSLYSIFRHLIPLAIAYGSSHSFNPMTI